MNDFVENDIDIENQEYKDLHLTNEFIKNKTFGSCNISGSYFFDVTFDNVIFNYTVFSHVDLSNVSFINCGFHHCQFIDCKMMGTNFVDDTIKTCKLDKVIGKYMAISSSKINDFSIIESDLTETRFIDVLHKKWFLQDVNLKGAEFNRISFARVDLSTCNIENILIDSKYLKGVTVSYDQILELAPILGIKLK